VEERWKRGRGKLLHGKRKMRGRGEGAHMGGRGARGHALVPGPVGPRAGDPLHARLLIEIKSRIENRKRDGRAIRHYITQEICFGMMQHPCQSRFLFTRDTDTSHYTTLKIGRSETEREKRVTPEFGEYRRRKNIPLKFRALQLHSHCLIGERLCSICSHSP
jgi:hypothetical protein